MIKASPLTASLTTLALMACTAGFALAKEAKHVQKSVVVNASPAVVFQSIQAQRNLDPARKLVSYQGQEAVIQEHFANLPIIDCADCVYKEVEVPYKEISYELISSNHFRSFCGCWHLTPVEGGCTKVELTSHLETDVHLPFERNVTDHESGKDIDRRLDRVKRLAENRSRLTSMKGNEQH